MLRVTLSPQALAAAMNAELYRRGVPAFVRVGEVVRAPAGEGTGGSGWTFALERSPVPLGDGDTAHRFADALFRHETVLDEVAEWAATRFDVAWAEVAPRGPVFIPSPEPHARPPAATEPVAAENTTTGRE